MIRPHRSFAALAVLLAIAGTALGQATTQPEPPRPTPVSPILLAKAPTPGDFDEWEQEPESDIWSGWLSNGVRAHFRPMSSRKDHACILITVAGGEIQETADTRGLTQAGGLAVVQPSTSEFTFAEIQDLMSGLSLSAGAQIGMDSINFAIEGKPGEVETGIQLAHLLITDALLDAAALERWKQRQRNHLMIHTIEPNRVFAELSAQTIFPPGEVRIRPVDQAQLDRMTLDMANDWLRDLLGRGPIEVAIVGDLSQDRAEHLLRTYFGSLPPRPRISPETFAELRTIERPVGPLNAVKKLAVKAERAQLLRGFYAPDLQQLRDVRLMHLAASILSRRVSDPSSPLAALAGGERIDVNARPGAELRGFGAFTVRASADHEKAEAAQAAIADLFDEFSRSGPTQEEFDEVSRQYASASAERDADPRFWAGALAAITYRGGRIADVLGAPAHYQSFTAEDVRDAFARYCRPETSFSVTVVPDPTAPPQGFVINPERATGEAPAPPK